MSSMKPASSCTSHPLSSSGKTCPASSPTNPTPSDAFLGALAGESRELQPPGTKWTHAGCVSGPRRRVAWRVLDAQYFGVAQRRKRVFLVASGRDGFDPAEVLFEPDRLHGDSAAGEQAWQITTGSPGSSSHRPGGFSESMTGAYERVSVTVCFGGGNRQGPIDTAACLTARGHKCDFEVETFAAQSVTGQRTHALNTANGGKGSSEDGTGRGVPIVTHKAPLPGMPVAFSQNSRNEVRLEGGDGQIAGALSIGGGKPGQGFPAIAYAPARYAAPESQGGQQAPILGFTAKDYGADALENLAPTLRAGGHAGSHPNAGVMPAIAFKNAASDLQLRDIRHADQPLQQAAGKPGHDPRPGSGRTLRRCAWAGGRRDGRVGRCRG